MLWLYLDSIKENTFYLNNSKLSEANILYIFYILYFIFYILHFTFYILHFTFYILTFLHFYILHFHILHFTFYILHFIFYIYFILLYIYLCNNARLLCTGTSVDRDLLKTRRWRQIHVRSRVFLSCVCAVIDHRRRYTM